MVQNNLNLLTFSAFFVLSDLCTNPFFLYSSFLFFLIFFEECIHTNVWKKVGVTTAIIFLYSVMSWISSLLSLSNIRHCYTFLQPSLMVN